ncbi:hypothetical protein J3E68DRAFT_416248 [Trichoderma sp. SZMC 28012]
MDTIVYLSILAWISQCMTLIRTACKQMSLHFDRKINTRILLVIYRAFKYMVETGISAGACMHSYCTALYVLELDGSLMLLDEISLLYLEV